MADAISSSRNRPTVTAAKSLPARRSELRIACVDIAALKKKAAATLSGGRGCAAAGLKVLSVVVSAP